MLNILPHILIILLGIAGFLLSVYIRNKKQTAEPMICPIGHDCHGVIHSPFSQFCYIPVEVLGIIYYATIVAAYTTLLVFPLSMGNFLLLSLFSMTAIAFLFSLYLVSVQAFILRKWCSWCIISACICLVIFALSTLLLYS